jgi:hypothetical protein
MICTALRKLHFLIYLCHYCSFDSHLYVLCVTYIPIEHHTAFRPAVNLGKNWGTEAELQKTGLNKVQCTAYYQSKNELITNRAATTGKCCRIAKQLILSGQYCRSACAKSANCAILGCDTVLSYSQTFTIACYIHI